MAQVLGTSEKTITKTRSIDNFTVKIPDDGSPAVIVITFVEIDKDEEGAILAHRNQEVLTAEFSKLAALIEADNELETPQFNLPPANVLYAGLSKLFHAERARQKS